MNKELLILINYQIILICCQRIGYSRLTPKQELLLYMMPQA